MTSSAPVDHEIAIIGTGFAGIGMAIRLHQAGETSFTVFEQAASVGGTWRDNTYPGAACDVPSHLYSFSFEPNPTWSRTFACQEEILAYLELCTDKYGIEPYIRFNTAVIGARFDDDDGVWTLSLSDGSSTRARSVISGTGGLSRPNYPAIAGLDDFAGPVFHSARWDHHCDLDGKTVAVIGTGASAIQIVPQVAKRAAKLHLFQRSAPWVLPKDDRPISPRARRWFARAPLLQRIQRWRQYWNHELRAFAFVAYPQLMGPLQKLAERYLARAVPDPQLRAKVTPDYTMGCKRILLANDYYPALQQDHVEVVTDGITRIRPDGIETDDGQLREVDVVILCTGFKAAEDVAPYPVTGLGGVDLGDSWRNGAQAYLGTTVSGFPNFYMLVGPNTGLGHNSMVFMIEAQITYVMSCLRALRRRRLRYLDVRADAQSRFNQSLQSRMAGTIWQSGCTSWYQTSDGIITTLWPGFTAEFKARTLRMNPRHYHAVPADAPVRRRPPTAVPSPQPEIACEA